MYFYFIFTIEMSWLNEALFDDMRMIFRLVINKKKYVAFSFSEYFNKN